VLFRRHFHPPSAELADDEALALALIEALPSPILSPPPSVDRSPVALYRGLMAAVTPVNLARARFDASPAGLAAAAALVAASTASPASSDAAAGSPDGSESSPDGARA
jgi:hypothetical protein